MSKARAIAPASIGLVTDHPDYETTNELFDYYIQVVEGLKPLSL